MSASPAAAQASYVLADAAQDQDPLVSQQLYNTNGPAFAISGDADTYGGNAVSEAELGVLKAHAIANADPDTSAQDSVASAVGGAVFYDTVFVSDDNLPSTAYIPTTVTFNLQGSLSVTPPQTPNTFLGFDDNADVDASAYWYSFTGPVGSPGLLTLLGQGDYGYGESISQLGTDQGGGSIVDSDTSNGSISFTTFIQNDSFVIYTGSLLVTAMDDSGGDSGAFYSDTALYTVTSSDANATFIGSLGTNYSTLTDNGSGATAAPEPGALALLLPALAPLGLIVAARRRRFS